MSDLLPENPCLEQYRRQAKDLTDAAKRGDAAALDFLRAHHPDSLAKDALRLTDAQHAIARSHAFSSWPKMRDAILERLAPAMFRAAEAGDLEQVRKLLSCAPELAKLSDPGLGTPLTVAASSDSPEIAEILIRHGADPSVQYASSGHTALSWAITIGAFNFAREVVRLGDRPDLFCAAGLGDMEAVKSFWPGGSLKPSPSRTGSSRTLPDWSRLPRPPESDAEQVSDALYMAARNGHAEVVGWLLEHGADPNFRAYMGGTPLHWAESAASAETASLLRGAGGDDELLDYSFQATPKAFSVKFSASGDFLIHLLRAVLDRYPDRVNAQSGTGTALHTAANENAVGCAVFLLERGADPTLRDPKGRTPADVASERGFADLARFLTRH